MADDDLPLQAAAASTTGEWFVHLSVAKYSRHQLTFTLHSHTFVPCWDFQVEYLFVFLKSIKSCIALS